MRLRTSVSPERIARVPADYFWDAFKIVNFSSGIMFAGGDYMPLSATRHRR
jgi:hypothetical protein